MIRFFILKVGLILAAKVIACQMPRWHASGESRVKVV
jgi:hypothetical protein